MTRRRALITGITGQDGSYLAEFLAARGYEIFGVVRRPQDLSAIPATMLLGDLHKPATLTAAVYEAAPDELYHLAAPTFVPDSWEDPAATIAAIAGATAALLVAATSLRSSTRVYVANSSEIFGDSGESPQSETSPMRPRSPYGVAKLAAHGLVRTLRERTALHVTSGITFNHESPRRPEHFVTRKVTRGAAAIALGLQEELVLGDMRAVRDWSHARDVVRGAWLALQQDEPGDYVLSSGRGRTVEELANTALSCAGVDPQGRLRSDPALVRSREATLAVGDSALARARLGWEPEISFEEMIQEMVDADLKDLRLDMARHDEPASSA